MVSRACGLLASQTKGFTPGFPVGKEQRGSFGFFGGGTLSQGACGSIKGNLLSTLHWECEESHFSAALMSKSAQSVPTYLVYLLAFLCNGVKSSFTRFREAFNYCLL